MRPISAELPSFYAQFLPEFFNSEIHAETFATCDNCAMVCKSGLPKEKQAVTPFAADKKCCTFYPSLPNYLVGGLLSDAGHEEGRKRIREKIRNRQQTSPAGIFAPHKYNMIYASMKKEAFGNSKTLLCPYFEAESGNCSIWQYREAVCSTFFCKTIAGRSGKIFWDALKSYLSELQAHLGIYALQSLQLPNALDIINNLFQKNPGQQKLSLEEIDDLPMSDTEYKKLWGEWAGREEEFYIACYQAVRQVTKPQFEAIMGVKHNLWVKDVAEKRQEMLRLPAVLKLNEKRVNKRPTPDTYEVYLDKIDVTFDLPAVVMDSFDGLNPSENIKQHLDENLGIELDDELILSLYKFNVLVEVR